MSTASTIRDNRSFTRIVKSYATLLVAQDRCHGAARLPGVAAERNADEIEAATAAGRAESLDGAIAFALSEEPIDEEVADDE